MCGKLLHMTFREKLINEIDDFQLALGPEGDLEYRKNDKSRLVEAASEEWIDVLIDIAQNPPTDERFLYGNEEFWSDFSSVTSDILYNFRQNVHKVAPLLENHQTRVSAFQILCWSGLPEALDLIEPFIEQIDILSPDEVCHFVSALNDRVGERNEKMIDEVLLRVPDYPLPKDLIFDDFPFGEDCKTLYAMVNMTRDSNPGA